MKFQYLVLRRIMVPIKNHIHPPTNTINKGKQSFKTPKDYPTKFLGIAKKLLSDKDDTFFVTQTEHSLKIKTSTIPFYNHVLKNALVLITFQCFRLLLMTQARHVIDFFHLFVILIANDFQFSAILFDPEITHYNQSSTTFFFLHTSWGLI